MGQQKPIILPPQVIAALYENILIDESDDDQGRAPMQHAAEKKKAIFIAESEGTSLTDNKKLFLDAIIKACKLNPSEVEVITDNNAIASDYKKICEQYSPASVILFGPSPSAISLPVFFPAFQVQLFQETKYLYAPALENIENDKSLKLQLWQCLKQLFP